MQGAGGARSWQPTLGHILTPARYQLLLVVQKQKRSCMAKKRQKKAKNRRVEAPKLSSYLYKIYKHIYIYAIGMFFLLVWPGPKPVSQVQNYVKVVAHEK